MNYIVVTCLLALTASASADAPWGGLVYAPKHASVDYYAYPRYAFEYSVKDPHTGDNKAQWEMRDGDVVKGSYSLVEPGGSIRIVDYWADSKSGFNANVRRIGAKVHPTMVATAPIYKAPLPILSTGAVGPISVGPIGKLGGLAGAPLWTGHSYGGAISTASVIKSASPAIATPVAAAPIIAAPAPLATPVLKAPILSAPVLPAPIVKAPILPAYTSSLLPAAYPAALPVLKAPYGLTGWDNSLLRGPLSTYGLLGDGYLSKGLYSTLPALGASWGYPTLGQKYK